MAQGFADAQRQLLGGHAGIGLPDQREIAAALDVRAVDAHLGDALTEVRSVRLQTVQQGVDAGQLGAHGGQHAVVEPVLLLQPRLLMLQRILRAHQLVVLRQQFAHLRQLPAHAVDLRHAVRPVQPPAAQRMAVQAGIRVEKRVAVLCAPPLLRGERPRALGAEHDFIAFIGDLGGDRRGGEVASVIGVRGDQADLDAALEGGGEGRTEHLRDLERREDVGEAQQAEPEAQHEQRARKPDVAAAAVHAALAEEDRHAGGDHAQAPEHRQKVDRAVGVAVLPADVDRRKAEGELVPLIGEHAQKQQKRGNQQQIPAPAQRILRGVALLQCDQQGQRGRKQLRKVVEIPQIGANWLVIEKAVLAGAQNQPQHRQQRGGDQQPADARGHDAPLNRDRPAQRQSDIDGKVQQKGEGAPCRWKHPVDLVQQSRCEKERDGEDGHSLCLTCFGPHAGSLKSLEHWIFAL